MTNGADTNPTVWASLLAKLRTLDLTEAEAAALADVFTAAEAADEPEVEGFGMADMTLRASDFTAGVRPRGFKGTDEELQAIIDWLGSLEAQG